MSDLFDSVGSILWRTTWQAAILALIVGIVIAVFRERISPRWQYLLWSVVLVRLLLLVTPSAPWSFFNLVHNQKTAVTAIQNQASDYKPIDSHKTVASEGSTIVAAPVAKSTAAMAAESMADFEDSTVNQNALDRETAMAPGLADLAVVPHSVRPLAVLTVLWLIGCLLLSCRYMLAWSAVRRRLRACRPVSDASILMLLENAENRINLSFFKPQLLVTSEPTSPYVTGTLWPKIVLPESMLQTMPSRHIEFVLAHELAHIRRGDVWIQAAMLVMLALHWFNPFSWLTARQLRITRETACDDLVVSCYQSDRCNYANAILSVSSHLQAPPLNVSLIGLFHRRDRVSDRVRRLVSPSVSRPVRTVLSVAGVIALAGFGLTDASEPIALTPSVKPTAASQDKTSGEQKTYVISGTCHDWEKSVDGSRSPQGNVTLKLISARGLRKHAAVVATTKTDAEGKFEFAPVEPPNNRRYDRLQYFIEYNAPGFPRQHTMVWSQKDSRTQDVYLIRSTGEVKGRVVNEQGKPIVGARVMPNTLMPSSAPGFPMTTTNEKGLFRLTQLPTRKNGIYLIVKHADYLEKRVTVKPGMTRIMMTVGCQLTGSVREKSTNKPAAGVIVTTRNESTFSETHAVTDSVGNFTTRVPQGTYRVVVEDPNLVAKAIEKVECRAGTSVPLKPFLVSSGGWIVGKVVNTKTGQPMVRNEKGERVGLGYFGPSRTQGRVISSKILAEVRDDGTFRMRAAAGDNYPYFYNVRGSRMPWDTMKQPPVVVKEGAETEITLKFTPEMTPEEKIAEGRQIRAGLPKATDERIAAIITEFRKLNHTVDKTDIWCPLLQELKIIGRDAVPALCKEFEQTKERRMMQRLAYALRVINDPRAVPTLIRCLPKTYMTSSSDYGLIVHDPKIMEFMQANCQKGPEHGAHFSFGQVQRETYAALEKLTKHKINDRGILSMRRTDDRRSNATKEQHYYSVAKEWATWWERNWKNFNVDIAYRDVNLPRYTPPALGPLATGRELPPGSTVSGGLIGKVLSPVGDADRGATFFFDLDTGRSFKWPKQLPLDKSPATIELAKKWGTENDADLMCVKRTTEDGKSHYELIGLGLQLWQIDSLDAENFKQRIANGILPEGRKAKDALLYFDPQSKKYIHKRGISFVYVTTGESLGMITISDFITRVRDLTGTPSGMEPGGVGFHRGVKFNYHPVAR